MGAEAYSVAVGIYLKDQVLQGLKLLSAKFTELGGNVEEFQNKLNNVFKLGAAGFAAFAAGMAGLHFMKDLATDASDYAHQLNILNIAGMTHLEIAQSVSAAWKNTGDVITTTAEGNLKAILDLRNILGRDNLTPLQSTQLAIKEMPMLTRIQAILAASSESSISTSSDSLVYSLAKALDIKGAALDPSEFNKEANMMAKVIEATQGKVAPADYQSFFTFARQATHGYSNEFLYEQLPTFMMQMKSSGGGSGGAKGLGPGFAGFYKAFVQGAMPKAAMMGLEDLGLLPRNAGLRTTTTGTSLTGGTHIKDVGLAQTNPLQWVQQVFLPAIRKKYGDSLTDNQMGLAITDTLRGMSTTTQFVTLQLALKAQQAYRDQRLIRNAMDPNDAYQMSISKDPKLVGMAMSAQWENLKTQLGMTIIPILLPTIIVLTKGLSDLVQVLQKYPTLTKSLGVGFLALSTALTGLGVVLMTAAGGKAISLAFRALGIDIAVAMAPFTGLAGILVSVGVAATGAYLAFKNLYSLYKQGVFSGETSGGKQGSYIAAAGNFSTPLVAQLVMDGEVVGRAVMRRFGKGITQQSTHGSGVNADISLVPNMLNAQGYGI